MREEREGPLTRVTNFVYRVLVIEAAFVLAVLPALLGIFFLEQDPSNIPLYAFFALFFGPAITAGVYAWRADHDLVPWLRFWKGWADSLGQSLTVWTPAVVLAALAAFNAAFAQVEFGFILGGAVVAAAGGILAIALLVIIGHFSFRTRDLFTVAMYGTASAPVAALGIISLCILAGAIVVVFSDWVAVLMASLLLLLLGRTALPMMVQIQQGLVTKDGSQRTASLS